MRGRARLGRNNPRLFENRRAFRIYAKNFRENSNFHFGRGESVDDVSDFCGRVVF